MSEANLNNASKNFLTVATLITKAALWREESRGGHYRNDFPERDDKNFDTHSIQQINKQITSSEKISF